MYRNKRSLIPKTLIVVLVTLLGGIGSMANASTKDFKGIWLIESYGLILEIKSGKATLYNLTDISCTKTDSLKLEKHADGQFHIDAYRLELSSDKSKLVLNDMGYELHAEKIASFPKTCGASNKTNKDPEYNFESYWQSFNDLYAFFDLYNVDWQAQYDTYRPQVTSATTEKELFDILSEMTSPLTDEHVSLYAKVNGDDVEFTPTSMPEWMANFKSTFQVITDNYFMEERQLLGNRKMAYGNLSDDIAYLNIVAMGGYHKPRFEMFAGLPTIEQDSVALRETMDEIVLDLQNYDALVFDLRFNGGGRDSMADIIASYFTPPTLTEAQVAYSKTYWHKDHFGDDYPVSQSSNADLRFEKPIVFLTSGFTVSAAEIFTLRMRNLPNVTIIGEPTAGAFSDVLERKLPNGWTFGLSNERYTSSDGQVFENIGIPPNEVIAMNAEAFEAGTDTILERAIEILQNR